MSRLALIFGFYCLVSNVGMAKEPPMLSQYWFTPQSQASLDYIAKNFEITHRHGKFYELILPAEKVGQLQGRVSELKLIQWDIHANLKKHEALNSQWIAGYRDFAQVEAYLKSLEKKYPDIVKLETYGKSAEGRPLYALKISDNVHLDEAEPELMFTSATHGDELISTEVVLGIIERLLEGYEGKKPYFESYINFRELYFLPVINPDGFTRRYRYTADGTDPNRAYPWPENPDRNPVACIRDLINFFHSRSIVGSMDFHAYGRMVMYPWAYTYNPIESFQEERLDLLTQAMGETNGYTAGPISKVIYVAKGSSADYYFWKEKTAALAIEIGNSKVPSSSTISQYVEENAPMTWLFIQHFGL